MTRPGRSPGVTMVVAWLIALALAVFTVIGEIQALTNRDSGVSTGADVAITVSLLLLTVLFVWIGFRARARLLGRRTRRWPIWFTFPTVLFTLAVVGMPVAAVCEYVAWGRSQETQQHGIPRSGRVLSETGQGSCDRGSCFRTGAAQIQLATPIDGRATTTLHAARYLTRPIGASAEVLVDPQDPGYAELRGQELNTVVGWVVPLVVTILAWTLCPWALLRLRRRSLRSAR